MTFPPSVKVPQFTELRGTVHPLLEYTPKLADVDTAPLEDNVEDAEVDKLARVMSDKAVPIMTSAMTPIIIEIFRFAVVIL